MLYLLLAICCSSLIFIILKTLNLKQQPSLPTILISYLFSFLAGCLSLPAGQSITQISWQTPWLGYALVIGVFYIACLALMNLVTRHYGATTSVISSRLSLAIPVAFSLWVFSATAGQANWMTYTGLIMAIGALLLSSYTRNQDPVDKPKGAGWLPATLFLAAGALDAIINYANLHHVPTDESALFSATIFLAACSIALISALFKRQGYNRYALLFGLALGISNYFGTYFTLLGLHALDNNGSVYFPLWNMGVILLTSLVGVLIFKEPINRLRRLGILVALMAIGVLSQA